MSQSLNDKKTTKVIQKLDDYIESYKQIADMSESGYLDSCEIGDDLISEVDDLVKTLKEARSLLQK